MRETETDRQTGRQAGRQRETETKTETDIETERDRDREGDTDRETETESQRQRQTDGDKQGGTVSGTCMSFPSNKSHSQRTVKLLAAPMSSLQPWQDRVMLAASSPSGPRN